jgi:hypothetical protein
MKFIEISGGLLQPVSNEENIIIETIRSHKSPYPKNKFSLREKEIARNLVSRGILTRLVSENKLYFVVNDTTDFWER